MVAEHREMRITPARAGKTAAGRSRQAISQDHPRACGENRGISPRERRRPGSPPRVRGKHFRILEKPENQRITPARAGKTRGRFQQIGYVEDHPRACGENARIKPCDCMRPGSPPRVRGKLSDCCASALHRRITPARAGKTPRTLVHIRRRQDHPRACGENLAASYARCR